MLVKAMSVVVVGGAAVAALSRSQSLATFDSWTTSGENPPPLHVCSIYSRRPYQLERIFLVAIDGHRPKTRSRGGTWGVCRTRCGAILQPNRDRQERFSSGNFIDKESSNPTPTSVDYSPMYEYGSVL